MIPKGTHIWKGGIPFSSKIQIDTLSIFSILLLPGKVRAVFFSEASKKTKTQL
jgi:hypothetical protein